MNEYTKNIERKVKRILTRAARLVESGNEDFSCLAIREAAWEIDSEAHSEAREHYLNLFSPHRFGDGRSHDSYGQGRKPFGSATAYWDKDKTPERQQQRRDALLFAAASYEYAG